VICKTLFNEFKTGVNMKKFLLAALVLVSTVAFAGETVTVLDQQLSGSGNYMTSVDARFQVDQDTAEGFVDVTVTEERPDYGGYNGGMFCDQWGRCYPRRMPMPMPVVIFSQKVKVEGLMLMGDKVMYHGAEGNVECGTLGVSRVFRRPTIYLNGNCKLSGNVTGNYRNTRVVVTLKTK
jgi:hypothetical protein